MIPYNKAGYDLFHKGMKALSVVEAAGMPVDVDYVNRAIRKTRRRVKYMLEELEEDEVMKVWRRTFGKKTNLGSGDQLGKVLFEKMGFESPSQTDAGRHKTDETTLEGLDIPFVQKFLRVKKLSKAISTNLKGLLREVVDGRVHPTFNLHTVATFRSSSEAPNFQNLPVRDAELLQLVRRAFRGGPKDCIVETDYSGIEVRIAACYHKDPRMIEYIGDPTKDLHRDMAVECYKLPAGEVTKNIRYCGKNMFVFPQFYGDWYIDCARALWNATSRLKLTTTSGTPLGEHLASVGFHELGACDPRQDSEPGTFEHHIKRVERRFWEKRFPVYDAWKRKWFEAYARRGWFDTLTGFVCQGWMKKNEVINYPVQGSAFHCLLWALVQMVLYELRKRKMRTKIVGQIHDSLVAVVPQSELHDYLRLCKEVMVDRLMEVWDWIIVPLEIEAEVSPPGGSWAEKEKMEIPGGVV